MEEHPENHLCGGRIDRLWARTIMKIQGLSWDTRPTVKNFMILVALFAMMMGGLKRVIENKIIVLNRSGQDIAWVRVEVCHQAYDFEDISDGRASSSTFRATAESEFRMTGQLEDGTNLSYNDGYVTNSQHGLWATFIIEDGGRVVFVD
jgi:hypothetical protein